MFKLFFSICLYPRFILYYMECCIGSITVSIDVYSATTFRCFYASSTRHTCICHINLFSTKNSTCFLCWSQSSGIHFCFKNIHFIISSSDEICSYTLTIYSHRYLPSYDLNPLRSKSNSAKFSPLRPLKLEHSNPNTSTSIFTSFTKAYNVGLFPASLIGSWLIYPPVFGS